MDYSYQFQPSQSAIFQITGILVILFLIFFIQRDRRLRAHLHRAFFHPHGLYIDIYENRKNCAILNNVHRIYRMPYYCSSYSPIMLHLSFAYNFRPNFKYIFIQSCFEGSSPLAYMESGFVYSNSNRNFTEFCDDGSHFHAHHWFLSEK